MSPEIAEMLATFGVIAVFLIGMLFVMKLMLRRSHSGMDSSIQMQREVMKTQDDAVKMATDGLNLQKQTLAELQEIRKLLEKR